MNWKYWVIRKMNPASEKKDTVTEALEAVKRGLANRLRSSMGWLAERSRTMKPANSATARAKPPRLSPLVQPRLGASMIV